MGGAASDAVSKKASVCVKNNTGMHITEVQVVMVYRRDVYANVVRRQTWINLPPGKTTGADLVVPFETGFGDWTNFNYWFVQYACTKNPKEENPSIEYYVINPSLGKLVHGLYKQCYLTDEDNGGIVTIELEDCIVIIRPPKSSSAQTHVKKRNGLMKYPVKDGWAAVPTWSKIALGAGIAALSGGTGAVAAAASLGLGATSTAVVGATIAAGTHAYNEIKQMEEDDDANFDEYEKKTGGCVPCGPKGGPKE